MAVGSDPTDESGTPPSRSGGGMYTSTFAHRRSTSAEEQLLRMDDGEPENSRGTKVHHSKQPSREPERLQSEGWGRREEDGEGKGTYRRRSSSSRRTATT